MPDFLTKHRNILLVAVLAVMLAVSGRLSRKQSESGSGTVSLPVSYTSASAGLSEMEQYRRRRDDTALQDMAALQAVIDNAALDDQTRRDAAGRLQLLVEQREKQSALEGALLESSLWPCVAVVSAGSVSIVTEKESLSDRENALLLELSQAHTDIAPSGVRVICAGKK